MTTQDPSGHLEGLKSPTESQELYKSLSESTEEAVCVVDAGGVFHFMNTIAARRLGGEPADFVGKSQWEVFDKKIADRHMSAIKERIKAGTGQTVESTEMIQGQERLYRTSIIPLRGSGEETSQALLLARDITEHRQTESRLELNAKMIDASFLGITVYRSSGQCIFANQAAADLIGGTREKLLEQNFRRIPSWQGTELPESAERALAANQVQTGEIETVTTFGKHVFLLCSFAPLDFRGERHLMMMYSDVSEKRRAENALRQSEETFRLAMEATNDALWDWNIATNQVYRNARHWTMLGHAPDEVTPDQSEWETRIHPDDRENVVKILKETLGGERASFEVEYRLRTKSGGYVWVLGRGKIVAFAPDGSPLRMVGTNTDINDRKLTENTLRLHSEIMSNASEGVALVRNSDGLIVYANPRFEQMFGYDSDEMLGKHVSTLNAPTEQSPQERAEEILAVLRQESVWRAEIKNVKKDGTPFWCYAGVSVFDHPEHGQVAVSVHEDITDRKKAEQNLEESERRYRTLFESSPEGIVIITPDAKTVTYTNPAMCKMFGYNKTELEGMAVADMHPEEDLQRILSDFQAHARGEKNFSEEIPCRKKDGSVFYADINSATVTMNGHKRLFAFFRDTTTRRHAQKLLRESEAKYRALLESSPEGILVADRQNRRLYYANPTMCRMLGYTKTELEGMRVDEIHPENGLPHIIAEFQALSRGDKELVGNIPFLRKDGSVFYADVTSVAIEVDGNSCLMGFFKDATERRLAEQQRKAYQQQLQSLTLELSLTEGRERRALAAQLHDGPGQLLSLAHIKLATLKKESPPAGSEKRLAEISELVAQAERAARSLTFQIYPPALQDLGFQAGVEWLAENVEQFYGIKVNVSSDGTPLPLDEPVSVVLFQCLREALINVAKHAGVSAARVRLSSHDHGVRVIIEDKGCGFDTGKTTAAGGFGLFSIDERLRQLGGKMEINSRLGKGTTVYLDVPKKP